jgi:hypothetical protein
MFKLRTLILVFLIIIYTANLIEAKCPNSRFLKKHFPTGYQNNKGDAEKFAVVADRTRRSTGAQLTQRNSVFIGNPSSMTYTTEMKWSAKLGKNEPYCRFSKSVTKYNCDVQKDKFGNIIYLSNGDTVWKCYSPGKYIAYHAESNGHYERIYDVKG